MRKLLFLVLIAIAFCAVVETTEDVEAWSLKSVWNKVKSWVGKAVNFLKSTGIWNIIKNALGSAGAGAAGAACQSIGIPSAVCSTMVKMVADNM